MIVFRIVAAIELFLLIVEQAVAQTAGVLPIGGSHLTQIGVLFGITFVCVEVYECLQQSRQRNAGARKQGAPTDSD